jgi:hypothetical protein
MNCPRCSYPVPANHTVCANCGLALAPPGSPVHGYAAPGYAQARPIRVQWPIAVGGVGLATGIGLASLGAGFLVLAAARIAGLDPALVEVIEFFTLFPTTAAVPLFLTWFFMIRRNAGLWGPQRHTQTWAIAAWLVPIANLWYPFQMMVDAWRASLPPSTERRGTAPLIIAWWVFCLLAFATSFHPVPSTWEMANGTTFAGFDLEFRPGWSIASALVIAAAAGLATRLVWSLTEMQRARAATVPV